MRIVLDTAILVRATEGSNGPARQLLLHIVTGSDTLLLCNEILFEVAKVLRYPRMLALHGLSENRIYEFICFLPEASELVALDSLLSVPIRDENDIIVVQTAMIGDADVICPPGAPLRSIPLPRCAVIEGVASLRAHLAGTVIM